jgi:hypothetical protein
MSSVDASQLRTALLELTMYLSTSARGVVYEPKLYGSLRLMEAAERVIELLDKLNLSDDELNELSDRIVAEAMLISTDADHCATFTDDASLLFARKLRDA